MLLLFLFPLARAGDDCVFELGEWAFGECERLVSEARFQRANLVRGACEVIQDQLEKFLTWKGNLLADELRISLRNDLCRRFAVEPYAKMARIGIRSVIELAIEKNSRDRDLLGAKLEAWAGIWLTRVAKDLENASFEYVKAKDSAKVIEEYSKLKEALKSEEL